MRNGNFKFSILAAAQQLDYHSKKSCCFVYGNRKLKANVQLEAKEEPVLLGKNELEERQEDKYLGDMMSSLGRGESVKETVKERTGKVKGAMYEIRAVLHGGWNRYLRDLHCAISSDQLCLQILRNTQKTSYMSFRIYLGGFFSKYHSLHTAGH